MPWFRTTLFPGQQPGEQIYLVIRRHWVTLALRILIWLIFVAILLLADLMISRYAPVLLASPYAEVINLIKSVYIMFLVLGVFILWVMYYLNVMIVTNERVVDITQNSLLIHKISELNLSRTQDVTAEVDGILQTVFDFGDVYLQDAARQERFVFSNIPNPNAVAKLILDLYEQLAQAQPQPNPTKEV